MTAKANDEVKGASCSATTYSISGLSRLEQIPFACVCMSFYFVSLAEPNGRKILFSLVCTEHSVVCLSKG